jgi:hypothetical protein
MTCDFSHYDGSYVLGALSSADRQAFERHLADCHQCARSVRELAGLPGLLARVDPDVLQNPPHQEPVPDTVLPALVREVRRSRRRRAMTTVGLAAAGLAAAVTAFVTSGVLGGGDTQSAQPAPTVSVAPDHTMRPVGPPAGETSLRAQVGFESVAWGTRLDLVCSYRAGGWDESWPETYTLVVRTRQGRTEQVAAWRAVPGKTITLEAATDTRREDISSLEVRTAEGRPVLRLTT